MRYPKSPASWARFLDCFAKLDSAVCTGNLASHHLEAEGGVAKINKKKTYNLAFYLSNFLALSFTYGSFTGVSLWSLTAPYSTHPFTPKKKKKNNKIKTTKKPSLCTFSCLSLRSVSLLSKSPNRVCLLSFFFFLFLFLLSLCLTASLCPASVFLKPSLFLSLSNCLNFIDGCPCLSTLHSVSLTSSVCISVDVCSFKVQVTWFSFTRNWDL